MGSALLGALGLIAGIWAEKFDHLATFQNFIILPLTFLSGSILFNPLPTAFLARPFPLESVFLHNRWFSLWLLQHVGYFTLYQPWDCGDVLPGGIMADIADVEHGLQDPAVTLARAFRT